MARIVFIAREPSATAASFQGFRLSRAPRREATKAEPERAEAEADRGLVLVGSTWPPALVGREPEELDRTDGEGAPRGRSADPGHASWSVRRV